VSGDVLFGGVEAGGTKIVCAVGVGPDRILDRTTIPTTAPAETIGRVIEYFHRQRAAGRDIAALGVASFGPLDLAADSATFGHITTTTKPGWAGTDLVGALRAGLDVPIALDTDVNGAAYGEHLWGAGRGDDTVAYVTVGTGIGGGAIVHGAPLHGLLHPEMGHLHVQRHPADAFAGSCPFHGDCLEGLASGPAIERRAGRATADLGAAHHDMVLIEAHYLAQLMTSLIYVLMPHRIVLGGGVLNLTGLIEAVRTATTARLGKALAVPATADLDRYIVPPGLGALSGVLGALGLAQQEHRTVSTRRQRSTSNW
jgi:fructokinase